MASANKKRASAGKRTRVLAWHFLSPNKRLSFGDGRLVQVGKWLEVEGEPVCCHHGLHASSDITHAAYWAEAHQLICCRVELGGNIVFDHSDPKHKMAASKRRVLWWVNLTGEARRLHGGGASISPSISRLEWEEEDNPGYLLKLVTRLRKRQLARKKARATK